MQGERIENQCNSERNLAFMYMYASLGPFQFQKKKRGINLEHYKTAAKSSARNT